SVQSHSVEWLRWSINDHHCQCQLQITIDQHLFISHTRICEQWNICLREAHLIFFFGFLLSLADHWSSMLSNFSIRHKIVERLHLTDLFVQCGQSLSHSDKHCKKKDIKPSISTV